MQQQGQEHAAIDDDFIFSGLIFNCMFCRKIEGISYIKKHAQIECSMRTLIQIHKEGKYFVAIDLITNVADQGLTESEAISNLKKGLEEHYQVLLELAPKGRKLSFLDIEVEGFAQASGNLS